MNRIRGFLSKVSKGFAFFRKTLTNRAVRENAILLLTAPLFPKLHIRLRVKYGHYIPENPIDLSHPKLFNEKLLWLQYYIYNKSPLVQQCYDKYRVRDFVRQQGCEYTLNPIYGVWDDMNDIPWDSLPAQCAIKATSGWSNHVFRTQSTGGLFHKRSQVISFSVLTENTNRLIRNRQRKDSAAGKNNGLLSARRASFLRRKKISIIFVSIS